MILKEVLFLMVCVCVWTKTAAQDRQSTTMSATTTGTGATTTVTQGPPSTTRPATTTGTGTTTTAARGPPSTTRSSSNTTASSPSRPPSSEETSAECDGEEVRTCFMSYAKYVTVAVSMKGTHRARMCRTKAEALWECEEKTKRCSEHLSSYLSLFHALVHHVCGKEDQGSFDSDESDNSAEDFSIDLDAVDWANGKSDESEERSREEGSMADERSNQSGSEEGDGSKEDESGSKEDESGSKKDESGSREDESGSKSSGINSRSNEKEEASSCSKTCDLHASAVCFLQFMDVLSQRSITGICRQSLWSTKCMMGAVAGCQTAQKHAIMALVNKVMLTHDELCGSGSCELEKAVTCLGEAGTTVEILLKQLSLGPLLCGQLKGALACVYNHTSNCKMGDFSSMEDDKSDESMDRGDNSSRGDNSTSAESSTVPSNQRGDNSTASTVSTTRSSGEDGVETSEESKDEMSVETLMVHLHTISVVAHYICQEQPMGKDMMKGGWLGGDLAFSILLGSPYTRPKDVCGQVFMHEELPIIMTGGNFEKCRSKNFGLFKSVSRSTHDDKESKTSDSGGKSGSTESGKTASSGQSGSRGSREAASSRQSGSRGSGEAASSRQSGSRGSGKSASVAKSDSRESGKSASSRQSGSTENKENMDSRTGSASTRSKTSGGSSEGMADSHDSGSKESQMQGSKKNDLPESEEDYWENYQYKEDYFNKLSDDFLWGLHMEHKSSQQMFYHIIGDTCVNTRDKHVADCQSASDEVTETVRDATTTVTPTTARCEFDAGMACVLDSNVHEMALQVFLSTGNYKEAVRDMCFEVRRTLTCAYDNIAGCEIYQKGLVTDAVHNLLYIVGNQCQDHMPSTTPPRPPTRPAPTLASTPNCPEIKPTCRIGDIEEECFVDSQSGVSCDSYNATLHCVGDLVRPCQPMQTSAAAFMLDNLDEDLAPGCSVNHITTFFDLPYDDSTKLAECSRQAAKEFRLSIRAHDEPTQRLCMTFWSFSECHADLDLPIVTKYLLTRSKALFNDFISDHCTAMEDGEAVPACDQPRLIGPCKAALQRFFYNTTSQMCESFLYGGCDGNDNRFDDITACQEKCVAVVDDGCDMSKASVCLSTHLLKLFTKSFMPFSYQSVICSKYDAVNGCVREAMTGCSSSAKLRHAHALEMYKSVYQWACPLIRPEVPDDQSCLPHVAEASLMYFGVQLSNAGDHNINETCKELSHTLSVVHATTLNCSDDQKDDVSNSLSAVRSLVGDKCPAITSILHCSSNSSHLVDNPESGEIIPRCSTQPLSCDVTGWSRSCLPTGIDESNVCESTATQECISAFISGCQDSDISILHEQLMKFPLYTGKACDIDITWPATYDPDMGAGNCTKQFYADLEEKFLLAPNPDRSVLCSVFAELMECVDEVSSALPLVTVRLVQTLGGRMGSELGVLCQAAASSPCEVGDPLKDETGDEYFCGRGSSGFCPTGSRCVISPTDRYAVCCAKVKNTTEKDCGSAPADLVFLVDESSSIGATNFQIQKDFLKNLISNAIISENIETGIMQVALVTFSRNPEKRFGLNTFNNTADMYTIIDAIVYDKSGTEIEKGLKYVREVTLSEAGARSEAPKIVILLTDGSSSDNSESEANLLRDMDVTLLVLGIGNVDHDQLKAIAGDDKFLFEVDDFSELNGIAEQFVAAIPCPEEPLTCHLSEAAYCYKGQARSLLTGLYPIGARTTVCSSTEEYAECVTDLTVTCSSEKRQKYLQVSDWTKKLVKSQAICERPEDDTPKYCRPEEAAPCLAAMSKVIARYQHTSIRTAICSQIVTTEACVLKSIKDCDEENRRSVLQAYQDMTTLARLACVAPQVPKPTPPDCEEEGRMCNDVEALNCLVSAHGSLVASKGNKETSCNALVAAKHCVKRQMSGCETCEKATVHAMYEKLVSRMGPMCPEIYCERCAALQCIEDLSIMLKTGKKEMCNMIESTKRCVHERAQPCSGEEQKKIYAKLDYVVMMTSSQCERVSMQCVAAFNSASLEILKYDPPNKATDSSSKSGSQANSANGSGRSSASGSSQSNASGSQSQSSRRKRSAEKSGSTAKSAATSGAGSGSASGGGSNANSGASASTSRQYSAEVDEDEMICEDQLDKDDVLDISWPVVDLDMCSMEDSGSEESGSKSSNSGDKSEKTCGHQSAATSSESQRASAQSTGSAATSGESQRASAQSTGSAATSGESQRASAQSTGSGGSQSGESAGTSAENSNESSENSGGSGGAKICMSRLAWMCKKARMSWECAQKAMLNLPVDRQQVYRQSLTGVWAAVQYRCAASKLQCFSCQKDGSNEACNARPVDTCAANKQACETVVDYGAKVITKGCVNPDSCRSQCTGNGKKCSYCCHGNLCNQPWDGVITESRTCVGVSAVKCAFTLVKAVAHTNKLSCSEVESSLECMKKSTMTCVSSQYLSIRDHVSRLESSSLLTKCRLRQLHCQCGLCGSLSLGIVIQNNFRIDQTVCRHLKDTIHGTSLATMEQTCSPADFRASVLSLNLAWSVIGDTCTMVARMNDTTDNATSAETSSREPPSSGETKATDNTTSGESGTSGETLCDSRAAIECVDSDMARQEVIMAMMYGFERVCSLKDMWMQCVEERVKDCSADKYTEIWEHVLHETSWVRGRCQRITMGTSDKCDIDQAMQCLTNLGKMSTATVMCEYRNATFDCVKEHTTSCLSVQRAPVDFVMGELKFAMESVCDTVMDVDDDLYGDIYHDLADCVVGFGHMIHRSMKVIGSNATTMTCKAVSHLQTCLYDGKLPPLAKIYTKSMAKMSTSFLKHICSTDDMDRPLYCHSCDRREAADCQSSTKLTICDPLTERCGSMSQTMEDGSLVYTKGCVSTDECDTACPTSTNCSYCCGADFCNAGALPDVTVTTALPNIVTEQAACGYSVADIVILLDESSSIGQDNFVIMAEFINNIITQLNIGEDSIHLGLATFSSQGHFGFGLGTYYDHESMTSFVTQLASNYGDKSGTNVAAGLGLVRTQIYGGSGNRPDVPDVILLLTDGEFESGYESVVEDIQQANISVLVVGIGLGVVQSQLSDVASAPRYIFTVDNFNVLDTIRGDFVQTIPCPPEPPSCVLHEAATCVSGPLVRLLVTPFTPLQYRPTLCSDLEMVEGCLSTSVVNCPLSNTNTMYKMAAWMRSMSSPVCVEWTPPVTTCDVSTVEKCLRPLMHKLSSKVDVAEVCPTLEVSLTCLTKVMKGNCSRDVVVAVSQTLHIVRGIVGDSCSTDTSESLCVLANPVVLQHTCDPTEVDTCVQSFRDLVDGYTFFIDEVELCKEYNSVFYIHRGFNKAQICVEDNTALCEDPSVRVTANTAIGDKLSTLGKDCEPATRSCSLPGQCSITRAFGEAVDELRMSPSCPSGNTLMPKISTQIYDCNSIQRYPAKTHFLSLLSDCPPISLLIPAADDIFVPLEACIQDFNTAVNESLTTDHYSGIGALCPAVRGISACFQAFYDTLEEIPAKFLSSGLLNLTHQVLNEFIDKSCNGLTELVICEGSTDTIDCPDGQLIDIQEAFYGRENIFTCFNTPQPLIDTACSSPVALDRYKEICVNETTCNVTAENLVTGDPCWGVFKYARIVYRCVAVNPLIVTETADCQQKNVVRCMNSFLSNAMLIGLFRLQDRDELCRSSLSLNLCINDNKMSCSTGLQDQYSHWHDIGSSIMSLEGGVCKEMEDEEKEDDVSMSCSPRQAWECLAGLGTDLSYYKTSRDKADICRLAKHSTVCYQRHLYNCTDSVNSAMSMTLKKVTHYALRMCRGDHMKHTDVVYAAPPKCVDPEESSGSHCKHVQAFKSLGDLFDEIFNPSGSQQRLCVMYASSLQSIYSNINACPSYIRRNVLSGLETVKAFQATDSCNVEIKSPCQPPPSNCMVHKAEACVGKLKVMLSGESSEVDDAVCSMRMEVKRCIDENIAECSEKEVYQVTQKYYAALQIIGTFCDGGDGGGDGTSDEVDPEVTDIYGCISSFKSKVSKVLDLSTRSGESSTESAGGGSKTSAGGGSKTSAGGGSKTSGGGGSKTSAGGGSKTSAGGGSKTSAGGGSKTSAGGGSKTSAGGGSKTSAGGGSKTSAGGGSKTSAGGGSKTSAGGGSKSSAGGGSKTSAGGGSKTSAGGGSKTSAGGGSKTSAGGGSKTSAGGGSAPGSAGGGSTIKSSEKKDCNPESTELAGACGAVHAAWTCIQTNLPRLAYHERVILNHTLYAVYQASEYRCKPQACHSCTELDDNDLCNKQHPEECATGEVCYAKTVDSKHYKGCQSSAQCDQSCAADQDCGYCCSGYLCNKPAYIEDPLMCDVSKAVTCAMEVVLLVTKTDTITERVLSASLTCMETYSRDCSADKLTIIYRVAKLIREMLTVSGCAAESSLYRHCGTVGVLSLGRISSSPFASDRTKCSLLNSTQTLLDKIESSEQCFSMELAPVLKSMEDVKNTFIGDVCSEDVQSRCEVDVVFFCFGITADNFTMDGMSLMNKVPCINNTLWETNTCVVDKMAACSSLQKVTISGLVNMYVNLTESSCSSASDVSTAMEFIRKPVTFDSDLELCISAFSIAVTRVPSDHSDVCGAYLAAVSCVGELQLSPFQKALGRSFVTLLSNSYDATYSCKSKTGSELVICEGSTDTIDCPDGQVIDIQEAFYGRENKVTCSDNNKPLTDTACSSPVALDRYKAICVNQTSCTVTASNSVTGDPCVNTYKYARIAYSCIAVNPGSNATSTGGSTEVMDCDLDLVYAYLAHHTIQLYTSRLFTQASAYGTCGNAAVIKSSVMTSMSGCASHAPLKTLLEFFDFAMAHVCVGDVPTSNDVQVDPGQCNIAMAEECFNPIIPYFSAVVKDTENLCWELESLHQCVQHYQQDCPIATFESVTDSLAYVMTTFRGRCASSPPPTDVCSVANALSCVESLTESSTGCGNLGDVRACINANMTGCSSLQDLIVRSRLTSAVTNRLSSCSVDLQSSDPVVDNLISSCVLTLDQNTTIFMNSNSPSTQTCDTLAFFVRCLKEKSEEMNIVVLNQALERYLPMYTALVTSCKASSEQFVHSGTCPVLDVGSCENKCFYDGNCQQNEKCCSNGCGQSCVLAVGNNVIAFDTPKQTSGSESTDYTYTLLSDYGYVIQATSIVFEVKACNDAHVGLKVDADPSGNLYEIVLGGWSNSKSVIRTLKQGDNKAEQNEAVLDCDAYKRFNVSWSGGVVTVMRDTDSGWVQLMTWTDVGGGLNVQFVGLTTARWSSGSWKVGQSTADDNQGKCDLGLAQSCMTTWTIQSVFAPFLGDADKQHLCEAPSTSLGACVKQATVGCPESVTQHLDMMRYLAWAGLHITGLCQDTLYTCSASMAVNCMSELSFLIGQNSAMLDHTSSAMNEGPDVCSVYERSRGCMTRYLYRCGASKKQSVLKTFEELECLMGNQCGIIDDPPVTGTPAECIDITVSSAGFNCSMVDAMECFNDLRWNIAYPSSRAGSICSSYATSLLCFADYISPCTPRFINLAKMALEEFAPSVSGCPTAMRSPCQEEEDLCKYTALTACVNVVRDLMLTSVEDAQLCVAFTNAWDCISATSADCPSNYIMSIQKTLNALQNQKPFLTCDDTIQVCYYRYIEIVEEILTKQPNAVAPAASGSGSKAKSGSGSKAKSGSGSKAKSGSGSKAKSGSGSKAKSGSGSKAKSGSGSKAKSESAAKSSAGSAPKSNIAVSGSAPKASQATSAEVWDNSASCNDVVEAYSCINDKLPSSGLPKALIAMFESIIGDLYAITEQKCQGMACYYCKKKGSNNECNGGWSVCSASQQACETVVEKNKITKGCVAPDKCKAGTKGKKTTYCCYGHLCNQPGDMVYYDPPTCDILITSQTVITLLTKVIEASNGYTTVFCSNVLLTVQELVTISSTCSALTGDKIRTLQQRLMTAEESVCTIQVVCERQLALDAIHAFNATIHSSAAAEFVCTEYQKTMQVLFTRWSTCGESEIAEMQIILNSVIATVDLTCQLMPTIEYTPPSDVIRIVEGGEAKVVEFVLTEDPAAKCNKGTCHVVISIVLVHTGKDAMRTCADGSLIPQLVVGDYTTAGSCGYTFTSTNWATKISVPFLAVSDGLYDGEHTVDVEVTATKYEDDIPVLVRKFATYQFVVIDGDQKGSVCTSINDPHHLTFDKLYYDNFFKGEFVMYRHTTLPYEVRVMFKKCGKASCNCAMMVRSGDDFFSVDRCSSKKLKIRMHFTNSLTVGTQMYSFPTGRKFQKFKVTLPTGTEVVAQVVRKLINIQIHPSPSDRGMTEGLCGNYDGDVTNDLTMPDGTVEEVDARYLQKNKPAKRDHLFPNKFSRSWQIRDNYWFFNEFAATLLQPFPEENPVYCTCPASASDTADPCQSIRPAMTCPSRLRGVDLIANAKSLISSTVKSALDQVQVGRRRRRQAVGGLAELGIDEDAELEPASWPAGNWTEAMAQAHCEDLLTNSNLAQSCAGVDVANGTDVAACMADIQRSEGTEFDEFSTTNQMGRCLNELEKDPTFNTDPAAQAVATGILDQTCEDNCNSNGNCQEGVCRCYSGFIGVTCSVTEGEPPIVDDLDQNTCDTSTGTACNTVSVDGEKFVDLPTLTCHFETVEMIAGVFLRSNSETTAPANFISFNLVECELPASLTPAVPLRAVLVSVSNNGVAKSAGDQYFIGHNSQCYTCGATSCQTTLTGCVIGAQCYGIGDVSSANPCHFCDPVTSVTDWTVKIASYCPDATTTTTGPTTTTPTTPAPTTQPPARVDAAAKQAESAAPIIITGIIAGVSLLALVVFAFCIYRKRNSMLKDGRLREIDSESSSGSGSRPGWSKNSRNKDLYYDNSVYNYHYGFNNPQNAFANNIPTRHNQMSRRDPTHIHSDSRS